MLKRMSFINKARGGSIMLATKYICKTTKITNGYKKPCLEFCPKLFDLAHTSASSIMKTKEDNFIGTLQKTTFT